MNKISQVIITSESGSIFPEYQWHETLMISREEIKLIRNGKGKDTFVNEGEWIIMPNDAEVKRLFDNLEVMDYEIIQRLEPEDPLDGGFTLIYQICFLDGRIKTLHYDSGVTYTNDGLILGLVDDFTQSLVLMGDAAVRYKPDS